MAKRKKKSVVTRAVMTVLSDRMLTVVRENKDLSTPEIEYRAKQKVMELAEARATINTLKAELRGANLLAKTYEEELNGFEKLLASRQ